MDAVKDKILDKMAFNKVQNWECRVTDNFCTFRNIEQLQINIEICALFLKAKTNLLNFSFWLTIVYFKIDAKLECLKFRSLRSLNFDYFFLQDNFKDIFAPKVAPFG